MVGNDSGVVAVVGSVKKSQAESVVVVSDVVVATGEV